MYSETGKMKEQTNGPKAITFGFLKGLLLAFVFTLLTFVLFACLLAYTALSEGLIPAICIVVQSIGAAIAGFSAAKAAGNRGMLWGVLAGFGYMAVLWLCAYLAGGTGIGSYFLLRLLLSLAGGALGGIIGVNTDVGAGKRNR